MTISEALKKHQSIEIDLLLSHVLGKSKEFLYINAGRELTQIQTDKLTGMVARRMNGEPIAYILGYKDFAGLRLKVNKDVLIPRPESEWLVQRTSAVIPSFLRRGGSRSETGWLEPNSIKNSNPSATLRVTPSLKKGRRLHPANSEKIRILDLGTGSGCIIVGIAKELSAVSLSRLGRLKADCQLTATDISSAALKVAKENAKSHHVEVKFIKSDLFQNIPGKFDIIVANLPYVPLKLLHRFLLHKGKLKFDDPFAGLKYEPSFALTDGTSSWQIYRRFFEQVKGHINKNAVILLETDPASKKFLLEYKEKYLPKAKIKFYKDFNGLMRFVELWEVYPK